MTWTRDKVSAELSELIRNHAESVDKLDETTELVADLGIDSLGVMELVADIEDRFELAIDDEELREVVSIGDVITAIEARLREKGQWAS